MGGERLHLGTRRLYTDSEVETETHCFHYRGPDLRGPALGGLRIQATPLVATTAVSITALRDGTRIWAGISLKACSISASTTGIQGRCETLLFRSK